MVLGYGVDSSENISFLLLEYIGGHGRAVEKKAGNVMERNSLRCTAQMQFVTQASSEIVAETVAETHCKTIAVRWISRYNSSASSDW